jgi:hypothetical protein
MPSDARAPLRCFLLVMVAPVVALAVALVAGCRGAEAPTGPLPSPLPQVRPDAGAPGAAGAPGSAEAQEARDAGVGSTADAASGGGSALAAATPCTTDDSHTVEGASAPHDALTLTRVAFADLPGWADDHLAEALPAFLRSCEKLRGLADDAAVGADGHGGKARQWRKACAAAARVKPGDDAAARAAFEAELVPYVAAGTGGPVGKLTGFYVAELTPRGPGTASFRPRCSAAPTIS